MSPFDDETRVVPIAAPTGTDDITFGGQVHPSWNIGANPNGGYLLALAAQAVRQRAAQHPDPLSISVHYLRPGLAGQPCRIRTRLLRSGRTLSTLGATLEQDGSARLELPAPRGNLGDLPGALGRGPRGRAADPAAARRAAAPGRSAARGGGPREHQRLDPLRRRPRARRDRLPADGGCVSAGGVRA